MIFTWGIIIILALGLISGYRSGLVSVVFSLLAYILAWLLAMLLSDKLAEVLFNMFTSNTIAHAASTPHILTGSVFFVIFSICYTLIRHVGRDLNIITRLPIIHTANALLGAGVNFIVRYLLIFLILTVLTLFPNTWVQQQYHTSNIAQLIVKQTPVLSKQLLDKWQS